MLARQNEDSQELAHQWHKIEVGGSDAHTSASAATAYTEVPGARNKEEFFAGLRAARGRVAGHSGNYMKLTRDILLIGAGTMRERHWTMLLAPLSLLVPVATFLNYRSERKFGEYWAARVLGEPLAHQPQRIAVPHSAIEVLT